MMVDVADVRALGGHRVHIRFADGVSGEVDVADLVAFEGAFAPLHPQLRTLCWPIGADLDPDVLYARVSGKPIRL